MSLIRCAHCRYSFEHSPDEAPTACPQCGERLSDGAEARPSDSFERRATQELKTIKKPND